MLISEIDLVSPVSLQECLKLLSDKSIDHRLIAGGTDAAVRMKEGKWRAEVWINIKGLHLNCVTFRKGRSHPHWTINNTH